MFGTSFRDLEATLPDVAAEVRAKMQERQPPPWTARVAPEGLASYAR